MQKYLVLLLLLTMQKCSNKTEVINSNNVKEVTIRIDSTSENPISKEVKVTQSDSLTFILRELNDCNKEPIKFYPTHRIKLIYNNGEEDIIFCSGSSMKFKGVTYRMNKSIRSIMQ
ncbi:hypothetical protein SIO70_10045 [Chitinophaga sancti]|uniref:hypothetical protein n=1 Tax=Chitinophaga sancti TaxID=1004 RepID=UPI002A74FAC8|nr:hypothetical protein [Chitinophaga sancti]WPQ65185.1 hypothetical protein SIO70_10045 [Chitinophaga sancti]